MLRERICWQICTPKSSVGLQFGRTRLSPSFACTTFGPNKSLQRLTVTPLPKLICRLLLIALLTGASSSAWALYKVVGPDGKVTYTDRPPGEAAGTTTTIGGSGTPSSSGPSLPYELRQAVARFPVSLHTSADCDLCNRARQFLRQRGIPLNERVIESGKDLEVLEQISGGRELPVLTIGGQVLRGFSTSQWATYLDAAGYPAQSKLPANFSWAPATTLTPRKAADPTESPPTVEPPPVTPPGGARSEPSSNTGIRF